MQRIIGSILALVGAFLLVVGVMAQFYVKPNLTKTPLNVDTNTYLDGTIQLSDGDGGLEESPILVYSVTRTDSKLSDDEVVVWQNSQCVVKDEGGVDGCVSADDPADRLVSASTDDFATDRRDALAVNDPKYVSPGSGEKEGLINKFPFYTEKKAYPYWDGQVGEAVEVTYDRTEDLDGLEVYVFRKTVDRAPIEVSAGIPGYLNQETELYVEPITGNLINQVDHQERLDEDGNPVIILDIAFTDDQLEGSIEESKGNVSSLKLITETVPLIGYAAGIPLLIIGLVMLFLGLRRGEKNAA